MDWDTYYMHIAMAVRMRANCRGRRVGAVIVKENRIISTGYNGTPEGTLNCLDGGCVRCENRDKTYKSGSGYDVCICVHAEQNALITAARFGNAIEGSTVYSTLQPCFDCTKAMRQAKVGAVRYLYDFTGYSDDLQRQYLQLQAAIPDGVKQVKVKDSEEAWAIGKEKWPSWDSRRELDEAGTQKVLEGGAQVKTA